MSEAEAVRAFREVAAEVSREGYGINPRSAMYRLSPRALVSSEDRGAWHGRRNLGVTGSDIRVLRSAGPLGRATLVAKKLAGAAPDELRVKELVWGRIREAEIARLVWDRFRIDANTYLFHAIGNERHLATPDGIGTEEDFDASTTRIVVSEIKTGKFDVGPDTDHFARYGYYDQIQWEMYVCDAWRCRFTWEVHDDDWSEWPQLGPNPLKPEPQGTWVLRDEGRIAELIEIADDFLATLDAERDRDPDERDFEAEWRLAELIEARAAAADAETALRSYLDRTRREALVTPFGKLSYGMGNGSERFNSRQFRVDHPGLYEEYKTRSTPRNKTLRVTVPGAKKESESEES
jgi:hypothetical protein